MRNKEFYTHFEQTFHEATLISGNTLRKWIMRERGIVDETRVNEWVKKLELMDSIKYIGADRYQVIL